MTVLGASNAGKKTFIRALQPTGDGNEGDDQVTNVYLRNVSDNNNSMIVFQFAMFDEPTEAVNWLRQSVACILLYDITNKDSFNLIETSLFDFSK